MAVGDRVQEPETKLEMDECSVEPRHHQMLM
jgi:hypothetical protein